MTSITEVMKNCKSGLAPMTPVIEYLDLEMYSRKRKLHSEIFDDRSFWANNATFVGDSRICFMCDCVLFKSEKNPVNDYENRIFHQCSDCNMLICDACTLAINLNYPRAIKRSAFCDCFLFDQMIDCEKFLCPRCSFSINTINVVHGLDDMSYSSEYINSRYSYKCFYKLLKKIFYNSTTDQGERNSVIRILNDFSFDNLKHKNTPSILSGPTKYIKNKEYSTTFEMAIFELSAHDIFNVK